MIKILYVVQYLLHINSIVFLFINHQSNIYLLVSYTHQHSSQLDIYHLRNIHIHNFFLIYTSNSAIPSFTSYTSPSIALSPTHPSPSHPTPHPPPLQIQRHHIHLHSKSNVTTSTRTGGAPIISVQPNPILQYFCRV